MQRVRGLVRSGWSADDVGWPSCGPSRSPSLSSGGGLLAELIGPEGVGAGYEPAPHAAARGQPPAPALQRPAVVVVVRDGEPTAYLEPDGDVLFDYPRSPHTLAATVGEVDRLTGLDVSITFFRLGDEPRLARFVDAVARRRCGEERPWCRRWTGLARTWWPTTCG
jgi:hypothetical protein